MASEAEDDKAKKAKAEKEATEPQAPAPTQEEADEIKDRAFGGETREAKAQTTKANYKTR